MKTISVLVVLYNRKIVDSNTLLSLVKIEPNSIDYLTIWNNGPNEIIEDTLFKQLQNRISTIHLVNDLSNRPLSKIYNDFINEKQESDYFIILDDDSILEASYLTLLNRLKYQNDVNLVLPKIIQHGQTHYPLKALTPIKEGDQLTSKNCRSISSGLIFDKQLVQEYKKQFDKRVFDERFALYGVDTSFFFRLAKLNSPLTIMIVGEISHSLSRLNKQTSSESKFRVYERAIDVALCARHYPSWITYKPFFKYLIKSVIKRRDVTLFSLLIKSYISAIHPKCR